MVRVVSFALTEPLGAAATSLHSAYGSALSISRHHPAPDLLKSERLPYMRTTPRRHAPYRTGLQERITPLPGSLSSPRRRRGVWEHTELSPRSHSNRSGRIKRNVEFESKGVVVALPKGQKRPAVDQSPWIVPYTTCVWSSFTLVYDRTRDNLGCVGEN
jgi:hypothetical protein